MYVMYTSKIDMYACHQNPKTLMKESFNPLLPNTTTTTTANFLDAIASRETGLLVGWLVGHHCVQIQTSAWRLEVAKEKRLENVLKTLIYNSWFITLEKLLIHNAWKTLDS